MRAMDDLTKLRNHYYHEYKNALDAKVIQQRRDIQKKSDELKRKIEMKKLQEVCVFVTKVFNFVQFCRKNTFRHQNELTSMFGSMLLV